MKTHSVKRLPKKPGVEEAEFPALQLKIPSTTSSYLQHECAKVRKDIGPEASAEQIAEFMKAKYYTDEQL